MRLLGRNLEAIAQRVASGDNHNYDVARNVFEYDRVYTIKTAKDLRYIHDMHWFCDLFQPGQLQ